MAVNLKGRSFLTLMDFEPEEIRYLLDLAKDLKASPRSVSAISFLKEKIYVFCLKKHLQEQDVHLKLHAIRREET